MTTLAQSTRPSPDLRYIIVPLGEGMPMPLRFGDRLAALEARVDALAAGKRTKAPARPSAAVQAKPRGEKTFNLYEAAAYISDHDPEKKGISYQRLYELCKADDIQHIRDFAGRKRPRYWTTPEWCDDWLKRRRRGG